MKLFQRKDIKKYIPVIFFVLWFFLFLGLSIFRDARSDENIYLLDSAVIADLLKQGKWIGNYGVGLHGFLSKLVVGIIYIFTGPSVFVATLFNILLGICAGVVFYKILRKHFKFNLSLSLVGVSMLFCSFQFLTYIPTFYRDIGSLLFVLLALESILSKKSKWITGLFLMLLLDSKEHVFYTLGPAFVIWIAVESWQKYNGKSFFIFLKDFINSGLKIFLPPLVYLILMFTTPIIPLNSFNANILGIIDEGLRPLVINFDPQYATTNRDLAYNPDTAKVVPTVEYSEESDGILSTIIPGINILLSYIGKISYPRTFSFVSVPFLVLIPSLATSIRYFKKWRKKKEYEKLFIPIAIFLYLIIYVVHASISRYMLPISPLVYIFFLMFIRDVNGKNIKFPKIFWFTVTFVILGLLFEYSYVIVKGLFSILILVLIWLMYRSTSKRKGFIKYLVVLLILGFTLGAAILASYRNGQIGAFMLYGYNRECREIMSYVGESDVVWINDIGWDRLPYVFQSENVQNPEWRWALQEWVPKKDMLYVETEFSTFSFRWRNEIAYKEIVDERKMSKIIYIELEEKYRNDSLLMQDRIDQISEFSWLDLENVLEMKNKIVYIFNVVDNE